MYHKSPGKNKYNNHKCEWNGLKFDSIRELNRYRELLLIKQENGEISDLQRQVPFELIPTQKYQGKTYRGCKYFADFTYKEKGNDKLIVEDVKGGTATQTPEFVIKQKLMIQKYGEEIDFRIY